MFFYSSPLGILEVISSSKGIKSLKFAEDGLQMRPLSEMEDQIREQLDEYFNGTRKVFSLKLDFEGYTFFQRQVTEALINIEYGQTLSYKQLATKVGKPKASRAIGRACGLNPLLIIVPCHRIITSDGQLGGYAGGISNKKYLLDHERRNCNQSN